MALANRSADSADSPVESPVKSPVARPIKVEVTILSACGGFVAYQDESFFRGIPACGDHIRFGFRPTASAEKAQFTGLYRVQEVVSTVGRHPWDAEIVLLPVGEVQRPSSSRRRIAAA